MANDSTEEILHWEKDFDTIYSYDAGPIRSKFLTELRDNERIVGTRCPGCGTVYVPARSTCLKCFINLSDFVEVSKIGTLTTFSVVNSSQPYHPSQSPLIYGIIQLEGADTGLVHLLGEVDPRKLSVGIKVQAIFKKERTGNILDIEYFKPIGGK
jgi:uncharacterized OB-fold protein